MKIDTVMQYTSYLFIAIGIMAFLVSSITQVIKSLPKLDKLPTSAIVIVLSLVLCPLSLISVMAWKQQSVTWYMIIACIVASFIVALVSMSGWKTVAEIWRRTKYNYNRKENESI